MACQAPFPGALQQQHACRRSRLSLVDFINVRLASGQSEQLLAIPLAHNRSNHATVPVHLAHGDSALRQAGHVAPLIRLARQA